MRAEFIQGIMEVARLCNWPEKQAEELRSLLLEELASIDNFMYEVYESTEQRDVAFAVYEAQMENLRRWLSLMLGIKIKYV
ncbi:MAG: hypothetical protein GF334_01435 [Candidatus Altiarchaeales archaeon]|nr:hypothetical protein [Candidatus Altiarchaeales archaeon]